MGDRDLTAAYRRMQRLKRGEAQYTDTTNAERFAKRHGANVRYCHAWNKWLHWNGMKWCIDASGEIHMLAKEVVREMYREAAQFIDDRDRRELVKHAARTEGVRGRSAMITALSWERDVWVGPEALDTDPWLFNCRNGTVDLRTGQLREHNRDDMITKMANTEYIASAECPRWKRFLTEITRGDEELIAFIAKAAGYALTADTREQAMFILHGNGANGKSTFLNTLLELFGDYAVPTPTETFMRRSGHQMSNDIALLRGTRLVTTIEADEGKQLSEPLIKQITGDDPMSARFLYGEYFTFRPLCKIFMATNHKPVITGTDNAIWRRIRLIPFTVTFPSERQDTQLGARLKDEFPGILNWLIEGCLRWQAEALGVPCAVRDATDRYRGEMDVIGNFLRERCRLDDRATVRSRELYQAYEAWCDENNEKAGSERLLAFRLMDMGYEKQKRSDARYWHGIGLNEESDRS